MKRKITKAQKKRNERWWKMFSRSEDDWFWKAIGLVK